MTAQAARKAKEPFPNLENCTLKPKNIQDIEPVRVKRKHGRPWKSGPGGRKTTGLTGCNAIHTGRSSKEEHKVDALAPGAEEGRDKLRKATGRSKYPAIRGYPNGETRLEELQPS